MLQTVTGFLGDGLGGLTSKVGIKNHMDIDNFMEFVARGDRETLITLYDNWKDRKATGAYDALKVGQNEKEATGELPAKSKANGNSKNSAGWSSQRSSRASSPVNDSSAAAAPEAGPSRKRSRNEKSNSGANKDQPSTEKLSSQSASTEKQNTDIVHKSKEEPSSMQGQPDQNTSISSTSHPAFKHPETTVPTGNTSNASAPSTSQTSSFEPPAAYRNYMELMAAATAPNVTNTATNLNHSFYTQQPNTNTNNQWQNFASSGHLPGYNAAQQSQFVGNNNNPGNAGPSNAFFFDTAEPMSMPTSSFTNEFLNQYIHTGLTPLIDPSYQNSLFPWSSNSIEPQQGAPTPTSSTSSMNQMPSPVNQNNTINQNNSSIGSQHNMQSQMNTFVPQLSLAQNALRHPPQLPFPAVPPQMYNPLASPRSSLPAIPPGFSPDELINSNPLLAAIHIISL